MKNVIGKTYEGQISMTAKGFGFVMVDDLEEDIFVEAFNTKQALHKDTVKVKILSVEDNGRLKGRVLAVIDRGVTDVVGTYVKGNRGARVIPDDVRFNVIIKVDQADNLGAQFDDKVKVTIKSYIDKGVVSAIVTEVLGNKDLPGIDILSMCLKHDIEAEFNPKTLEEAAQVPDVVSEEAFKDRRDLRSEAIFTIDGADAKDLDDAVGVKKLANGNFELSVSIADVTHYIKEGTALDTDAYARGTSVYLTDRVIPMIPKKLSNGICSLNPQVDRLTLTCTMEFNKQGHVLKHDIFPAVIKTKHRMTYDDVTAILAGDEALRAKYEEDVTHFDLMLEMADILKKKRHQRGSIEFDVKEAKIKVDDTGFPTDIIYRERGISEEIIEEFMLLANETVAEHFEKRNLPFIYRVHEQPNMEKMQRLYKMTRLFGYTIKGGKDNVQPKALQKMLEIVAGKKEAPMINKMMLRTMEKARYAERNLGHFGLAATYYTHFTSPIRRYPDLIVHRMIRTFLFEKQDNNEAVMTHFNQIMPEIADHTSKKERGAIECERDVMDMKKAEYMTQFIGDIFEGVISSITKWGMYIELPNTIEGLVRLQDMKDDFYHFNEDTMTIIGKHRKHVYRMGDPVKVKVKAASKDEGTIDFMLAIKPRSAKKSQGGRGSDLRRGQHSQKPSYRNKSKNKKSR
ncbi:MAG: ribonuclease R [Defluviitaleaceae bacterium]|nr:ribonuclease R [Defluviitaleaceae bacterium]